MPSYVRPGIRKCAKIGRYQLLLTLLVAVNYYWPALQSMSVLTENVYSVRYTQELAISFSYSDCAVLINAFR